MRVLEEVQLDAERYLEMNTVFQRLLETNLLRDMFRSLLDTFALEFESLARQISQGPRMTDMIIHNCLIFKQNTQQILHSLLDKAFQSALLDRFGEEALAELNALPVLRPREPEDRPLSKSSRVSEGSRSKKDARECSGDKTDRLFPVSDEPGPGSYFPDRAKKLTTKSPGSPKFGKAKKKCWIEDGLAARGKGPCIR
jgi:hypothetical protein